MSHADPAPRPPRSNSEPPLTRVPRPGSSTLPVPLGLAIAAARRAATSAGNDDDAAATDPARAGPRAQKAKRLAFLEDLITNLDIVVYALLSAMYYMDTSLFRLLMRLFLQWVYFTPKPVLAHLPLPMPLAPNGLLLVGAFLICLLNHVLQAAPAAGEAARGYIHGGLLIDFVGVKGPVSKWRLALTDVAILGLQWVLVGLNAEVVRVRAGRGLDDKVRGRVGEEGSGQGGGVGEDDTAERDRPREVAAEEARTERGDDGEDEDGDGQSEEHPLDRFYGGQSVIAEVRLVEALKMAWPSKEAMNRRTQGTAVGTG